MTSSPATTHFTEENPPLFAPKRVIPHGMILRSPAVRPEGTTGATAYELGCCLQLDETHCALLASLDEQGGGDLCVGNDAFVFEHLSEIQPEKAIVVNRGVQDYTMRDGRGPVFLAKFPAIGGFIPLGTKLGNGKPHPAAGTGFLCSTCVTFSKDKTSALTAPESFPEFIQMKWDGETLTFHSPTLRHELMGLPLTGDRSISPFCPQDEGLLVAFGIVGRGITVFRFEWTGNSWEPVAHGEAFSTNRGSGAPALPGEPWTHQPGETEPSIRRVGEHYFIYTRGIDSCGRFYKSKDGLNFSLLQERESVTVPQVLNQGLDGSLYVATNPGPGWLRNPLIAFDPSDKGTPEATVLHDQDGIRSDDGEKIPFVDHAISNNVRLDGQDRHFMFYRVCDLKERTLHKYQIDDGLEHQVYGSEGPGARRSTTGLYLIEMEF